MLQRNSLLFIFALVVTCSNSNAVVIESGDFIGHLETLRDLTFTSGSNAYVAPTAGQRAAFSSLAATLISGDLGTADVQAAALDYEVVQYTDNVSGDTYYGLREENNTPTRGWGSYFVNPNASAESLIEAPHPRFDTNSWELAGIAFRDSDSRGFLMAGAHRNANGSGTADVAHLTNSIFQEVHIAWTGVSGERTTWSIHGFNDANHAFPVGTDAVLSNGDGALSSEVISLDTALENLGFDSYAYNTLNPLHADNVAVNGIEDGSTFSSLGGTTNVQGQYTRSVGGIFIQAEFEQSIRFDNDNLVAAAGAVANTAGASVPEPGTGVFLAAGLVCIAAYGLRKSRCELQNTGTNTSL